MSIKEAKMVVWPILLTQEKQLDLNGLWFVPTALVIGLGKRGEDT
jgi:hypothetical protein